MATNWTQTVGQFCQSAAYELGAVGMGDALEASEQEEMVKRLNSMLAKWSVDAAMYREEMIAVEHPGLDAIVELPEDVLTVRGVAIIGTNNSIRPLTEWNRDEFYRLPNPAQLGEPSVYYFSRRVGSPEMGLWPIPTDAVTLRLDYGRRFFYAEGPEDTLDLPSEWHEAALYGLAARCANIFSATAIDPNKVQRIDAQARASYERMLDHDRPDSFYFTYDRPVEAY